MPNRAKHPDKETLEAYLVGSLSASKNKRVEEHLISCSACVETAKEIEEYVRAMGEVLDKTAKTAKTAGKARPG